MKLSDDRHIFIQGELVSEKIANICAAIKDYEPELDVRWIPPAVRKDGEAAFAIMHCPVGKPEYVLFYVPKEEDFDERVLSRIIYNDQRNVNVTWTEYTAWEKTQELLGKQKYLDSMEEAQDIAAFVAKTHLNDIRISKNLRIKDFGNVPHYGK